MPTRKRILKELATILAGAVIFGVFYLLVIHKEVLLVLFLVGAFWALGVLLKEVIIELFSGTFND